MKLADTTLDLIETLRRAGQSFCVATIVRTKDATSAKPGAKAVVTEDGELHGFLGGACVTGAIRKESLAALKTGEATMIRVKPKGRGCGPGRRRRNHSAQVLLSERRHRRDLPGTDEGNPPTDRAWGLTHRTDAGGPGQGHRLPHGSCCTRPQRRAAGECRRGSQRLRVCRGDGNTS